MIYGIAIGIIMIAWGIFGKYLPPSTAFMIMGPMIAVAAILGIISLGKNRPTTEKAEKTSKTTPKEPGKEDDKSKPTPADAPPPPPPVQPADAPSGINWTKLLISIAVLAGIVALFWHLSHVGTEIAIRQAAEEKTHPKPIKIRGSGGLEVEIDENNNTISLNGSHPFKIVGKTSRDISFVIGSGRKYSLRFSRFIEPKKVPGVRIVFHNCSIKEAEQIRKTAELEMAKILGTNIGNLCQAIETDEFFLQNGEEVNPAINMDRGFSICKRGRPLQ